MKSNSFYTYIEMDYDHMKVVELKALMKEHGL